MTPIVTHQTGAGAVSPRADPETKGLAELRDWRTFLAPEGGGRAGCETLCLLVSLVTVPAGEVVLTTSGPGQDSSKPGHCVVNSPGDDEVVVDHHQEGDHQHPPAQTCSQWGQSGEDLQRTDAGILA